MPHRVGRCLAAGSAWLIAWSASAAVLTPTILTDELASPGAGCSLREAVLQANRNLVVDPACGDAGEAFPADTIELAPNVTYVLSLEGQDDLAETGDLDISNGLVVLGNGAIVEAAVGLGDRVLDVLFGVSVELLDLTVRGGHLASALGERGGGIRNAGFLTMSGCIVEGNRVEATSAIGGGISSSGVAELGYGNLELIDCVIRGNEVSGGDARGGGIYAGSLTLVRTHVLANTARTLPGTGGFTAGGGAVAEKAILLDSWFEANRAEAGSGQPGGRSGGIVFGGGLFVQGVTISGSTFSGNVAKGGDGAVDGSVSYIAGHAIGGAVMLGPFGRGTIANSTFSGNSTVPGGGTDPTQRALRESVGAIFVHAITVALDSVTVTGSTAVGIYNSSGRVILTNSLAALQSGGGDCAGATMTSADFNLDSDGSCNLTGPNDQPAVPSGAVGLLPLAANGGFGATHALSPSSRALNRGETVLINDQRGVPRPQFARDDIGAVEQDTFVAQEIPLLGGPAGILLAACLALTALALLRLSTR